MTTDVQQLEDALKRYGRHMYVEAVSRAAGEGDNLVLSFSSFGDEPELLQAALAYASVHGVTVTIVPDEPQE